MEPDHSAPLDATALLGSAAEGQVNVMAGDMNQSSGRDGAFQCPSGDDVVMASRLEHPPSQGTLGGPNNQIATSEEPGGDAPQLAPYGTATSFNLIRWDPDRHFRRRKID